jgi:hypothetical protein
MSDDETLPGLDHVELRPVPRLGAERVRALEFAARQEQNPEDFDLALSARVFAQVSLPYREPAVGTRFWERRNGETVLTVRPALLDEADGTKREAFPFGLLPRHALTWMATEAVRTDSPELHLGRSMSEFMAKLDLAKNGQNAKRLTEGLRRLFGAQVSVGSVTEYDNGTMVENGYFQIAKRSRLWASNDDEPGVWDQRITLAHDFFESVRAAPVPIDLNAIKALGKSPQRYDMYLWLTHRMSYLNEISRVTWEQLNTQFGSQYSKLAKFKFEFLEHLDIVKIVYPDLNVEVDSRYLILKPSKTHVPMIPGAKRSKLILAGDKDFKVS